MVVQYLVLVMKTVLGLRYESGDHLEADDPGRMLVEHLINNDYIAHRLNIRLDTLYQFIKLNLSNKL